MRAIVNEIDGAAVQTIEDGEFATVRANVTADIQAMLDEVATGGVVQRTLLVDGDQHVVKVIVEACPFVMHAGSCIGSSDDSSDSSADTVDEALREAAEWASSRWPASDHPYEAVVWVEQDGKVLGSQGVEIDADGSVV